jgi:hypothetical protein
MLYGDSLVIKEMKSDLQGAIDLVQAYTPKSEGVCTVAVGVHDIENLLKLLVHCKEIIDGAVLE